MKCENCGKEHDGSYGSGRFCSLHCGKSYIAKKVKNRKSGFTIYSAKRKASYGTWKCQHCGIILESKGRLQKHIHDNHARYDKDGNPIIWNKGLTKETSKLVAKIAKTLHDGYKSKRIKPSFLGRYLTKEHKDKIIATYIQNRTNNKYRGTYKEIYFQYSFELAWIVWNLEHGIKIFRCEETFQYWDSELQKERTYYPDFVLEDGTIVEIKGRIISSTLDKQKAMIEVYHKKYLLLTQDKIQYCIDYCKEKYGNDFVSKLKDT